MLLNPRATTFAWAMPPLLTSTPAMPSTCPAAVTVGFSWMARTSTTETDAGASSAFSSLRDATVTTGFSSTTASLITTLADAVPPAETVTDALPGRNPMRFTTMVYVPGATERRYAPSSRDWDAATTDVADTACTRAPLTGRLVRPSVTVPVTVPFCAKPSVGTASTASDHNARDNRRADIGTSEMWVCRSGRKYELSNPFRHTGNPSVEQRPRARRYSQAVSFIPRAPALALFATLALSLWSPRAAVAQAPERSVLRQLYGDLAFEVRTKGQGSVL